MFTSLRSRLWLTYVLVIAAVLAVVGLAIMAYLVRNPPAARQALTKLRVAANGLQVPRILQSIALNPEQNAERGDEAYDVRVVVLNSDGSTLVDSRADIEPPIPSLELPVGDVSGQDTFRDSNLQVWFYLIHHIPDGRYLLVATPRPAIRVLSILSDELFTPLVRAGAVALLLSLVLAFLISRWVAAPMQRMAAAVKAVAAGEHQTIKPQGPSEVQYLARVFNEMTSRVHASQQSQRDFVANVSHELKTPLTSIQGFAQAILDGTAKDGQSTEQAAQVIHDESGRMHRLVVDLLDLARLDAGTADLQLAPLNLSRLLGDVAAKFTPQTRKAGVELQTKIADPLTISGDGDRLAQVFTNLIDNAIEHTPAGGQVTLEASQDGGSVKVAVADTGQGIPPEELSRIFERFYQVDKSRKGGDNRGVGLGLAIARQIVHAHGGTMEASSELEEGSVFTVLLPISPASPKPAGGEPRSS